jgi:hypothetical protein
MAPAAGLKWLAHDSVFICKERKHWSVWPSAVTYQMNLMGHDRPSHGSRNESAFDTVCQAVAALLACTRPTFLL